MKKNTTFFIALFLICASFSLSAQTNICVTSSDPAPSGPQCYTGCGANEFATDGTNTHSGVVRNTYNDQASSHLVYNGSMNRWEIIFPGVMGNVEFYNDADTAPNPPGLSVGTWVKGPGSGMDDCGTITAMTGGVQNTPLPIELTRFEANHKEGYNYLTWQTASESQNKGFEIEASPNPNVIKLRVL